MNSNSSGSQDLLIAKYGPNGNLLWAKAAGSPGTEEAMAVAVDASDNIIIAGYFSSHFLTFGSTTLINPDPSDNTFDMFVTKYDPNGNAIWAKSVGGTTWEQALSVATDASGHVIVSGEFESPTIALGPFSLTNAGGRDMFVAKLSNLINGIEITGTEESSALFPNPSSGKFTFNSSPLKNNNCDLEIYNIMGEKILSQKLQPEKTEIDLSRQCDGIYFCRITDGEKSFVKKIILSK